MRQIWAWSLPATYRTSSRSAAAITNGELGPQFVDPPTGADESMAAVSQAHFIRARCQSHGARRFLFRDGGLIASVTQEGLLRTTK